MNEWHNLCLPLSYLCRRFDFLSCGFYCDIDRFQTILTVGSFDVKYKVEKGDLNWNLKPPEGTANP